MPARRLLAAAIALLAVVALTAACDVSSPSGSTGGVTTDYRDPDTLAASIQEEANARGPLHFTSISCVHQSGNDFICLGIADDGERASVTATVADDGSSYITHGS